MARKTYSPEFKFTIVLEALKERETLQEIASKHGTAPSQISRWIDEFKLNDWFKKNWRNCRGIRKSCKVC